MKKPFILLGAISLSALISGCHMMGNDAPPPPPQQQNWDAMRSEHQQHMQMMSEHLFNAMDANHDGEVSLKEYMDFQRRQFREADTDHDGYLTLEEFQAQMMKNMKKMKGWKHDQQDGTANDGTQSGNDYRDDRMQNGTVNNDGSSR